MNRFKVKRLADRGAADARACRVRPLAILWTMGVAVAASLALATGLRFVQVRSFIEGQLAQIPSGAGSSASEVIFVRVDRGYYMQDLVQNDPFMEGRRWILYSAGPLEDARFMNTWFKGARLAVHTDVADLWQVD